MISVIKKTANYKREILDSQICGEDVDVGLLDHDAVWTRRQIPEDGDSMFL
jgi:hypothetical protein